MSLHEQLDRVAEGAPIVRPRADTWARAQQARRRERLAVGGAAVLVAAVVVLVTVLAIGVMSLPTERPGPAGPTGADVDLAVPDRIHAAPGRVAARENDGSWMREEVSDELAVGPAAAAYVMAEGLPVVVDAEDGAHHLLDLPGFLGNDRNAWAWVSSSSEAGSLAVSPDGRSLAYGYADIALASATEPVPSGIRVVDLETGEVRAVPLPGAQDSEGTAVTDLSWSPDGSWLAWTGERYAEWTPSSIGGSSAVAGRVELASGQVEEVPAEGLRGSLAAGDATVTVDDRGVVTAMAGGRLIRWDGDQVDPLAVDSRDPAGPVAVSPDGGLLAMTPWDAGTAVRFVDPATGGAQVRELSSTEAAEIVPLGWLDEGTALVAGLEDGADGALVLVGPTSPPRRVAVVEPGAGGSLSVAVDLMSVDRPTVDRPAPDFAWSPEQRALLVAVLVAAAALVGVLLWRRRRAGLGSTPGTHPGRDPRGPGSLPRHDLPQ